ncbi:MAG: DMT family transporter [Actinobacteria bacterium]|nr:MAG: DMT family transporter [Actinomycetota bacterium]
MTTQTTDSRERLGGLARVALAGLIWGTIPLLLRSADGASIVKVFFRMAVAGLVVGGWMLVSGRWHEITSLSRAKLLQISVQGLILTLNWTLFLTALDMTNVATAELLGYCGPVFVAALAPFVTGERFDRRVIAPLALALGGIVVILAPQGLAVASPRELTGAGLAFLSALTYATLLLRSKKILRGVSSGALMTVEYGLASVVLAPFVIAAYARGDAPSTPQAYAALITLGVVQTAIAGFIFLGGLRRVRTDHAAILTYIEPVAAIVFAAMFLGEPLTWTTVLGGALVVAGGTVVARLEAREGVETLPLEAAGDTCADEPDADRPSDHG